jgi:hypothetical protein
MLADFYTILIPYILQKVPFAPGASAEAPFILHHVFPLGFSIEVLQTFGKFGEGTNHIKSRIWPLKSILSLFFE